MKHIFIIILLATISISASSQQLIFGSVRDGFLKVPLPNARISLLTTDSTIVQDSIKVNLNKKEGERLGGGVRTLVSNFLRKLALI